MYLRGMLVLLPVLNTQRAEKLTFCSGAFLGAGAGAPLPPKKLLMSGMFLAYKDNHSQTESRAVIEDSR